MKMVTTLYLPLVYFMIIIYIDCAHADVKPLIFHENNQHYKKIPSNRNEIENNNNKNVEIFLNNKPATTQYSVVEDSQLLCQELCGANLGGPTCGAYCHPDVFIPIKDINIRNKLLKALQQHEAEICSTLCLSGLGRPYCKCRTVRSVVEQTSTSDMSQICDTFCEQSMLTMPGCSECRIENTPETTTTITTTTTLAPTTSGTSTPSTTTVYTTSTPEEVTSNLTDQSTIDVSETVVSTVTTPASTTTSTTTTTTVPPSTTPVTTTTHSTTITTTAKTEEPTTEPNWDELCASLCKIGEGGALCNCDLPPFF